MKMITDQKETVRNKTVLLYSGGMDSLIIDQIMKPDVLLNISMDSNYDKRERLSMKYDDRMIFLDDVLNLGQYERDDAIIPNRNAHLVLLASHYGETILLGSVSGDRSFDKDEKFYMRMEDLLNHMWQEQHWTEERKFEVYSPYKDKTKTELVKEFLENEGQVTALAESYSCYEGGEKHCGTCKACFRKWVSLENNGIKFKDYWIDDPKSANWVDEIKDAVYTRSYRGKEDEDIQKAMGW
jgi:7-cyano-7-deazaguanine synthase in queuosine biosynthesis|tara:strand:- start:165 stop:884 length:720 start_codon:yes stop_codon:yes gene_type:complete